MPASQINGADSLTSESRDEIEENRKSDADQDRRADLNEYRDILATVSEIAGEAPKRPPESRRNQQHSSNHNKQEPETEKGFSKFNHGLANA